MVHCDTEACADVTELLFQVLTERERGGASVCGRLQRTVLANGASDAIPHDPIASPPRSSTGSRFRAHIIETGS